MKKLILPFLILFSFTLQAQIQQLTLLGHLPFGTTCAGVWHYADTLGNEYALIGAGNGLAIVDVTNPATPTLLHTVPGNPSLWREVKTYGHYAYAGTEGGGGITIIDLSGLPGSYQSKVYDGDGAIAGMINNTHTVQVFDGYLYIFGSNLANGGALICDLADPWNPVYIGQYNGEYVHDGFVYNDTMYTAEIYAGQFSIIDITNKTNPVTVASATTPLQFCHNTWFSDDHRYLYTTDEKPNSPVGVYDLADKQNIQLVETFFNDTMPDEEVHNVRVLNDYLINPSYGSQLTIVDGARPDNLIEIARYTTGSYLCWDASPYLPSGNIIATDVNGGFYVFAPYYVRACYLEGNVTDLNTSLPINGVTVKILATNVEASTVLNGDYKTGYQTAGTFDVEFSKPGYLTKVESGVMLNNGVLTVLDVQLESWSVNGQVIDGTTSNPVPFAWVRVQDSGLDNVYQADANGNFLLNTINSGTFEITAGTWGYYSTCVNTTLPGPSQLILTINPGIYDDFTFDYGWTVTGNAITGLWERDIPVGTTFSTVFANPDQDAFADCSNRAFVTDNGGGSANDFDVDNGYTELTSPVFDLSGYADPYVNYTRWFFEQFNPNPAFDDTMFISLDNGLTSEIIEAVTGPSPFISMWVYQKWRVSDFLTPTANMQLKVYISDKPGSANFLEGGFDHFYVTEGTTGIVENGTAEIVVFPNPFSDQLQVRLRNASSDISNVALYDITGRCILSATTSNKDFIAIDTNELSDGIYLLTVTLENGSTLTSRVVRNN